MLSSSKDDEDDRIYSVYTAGGAGEAINTTEVVDPRTLIQFREMEQESFHLSRQGGPEQNLIQLQISGEEGDYSMINEEGVMKFSRRAGDQNLDGLSLDTSSLHASNLLQSSVGVGPQGHHNSNHGANRANQNRNRDSNTSAPAVQYETSKPQNKKVIEGLHQHGIVPQDSSSVDTELEVSINNAHLLTNLAKAVQDKERKSNFTATSEGTKVIQTQPNQLLHSAESHSQDPTPNLSHFRHSEDHPCALSMPSESSARARELNLYEELWLFAYEEQAEQACAEHDVEGKQRQQRENRRQQK